MKNMICMTLAGLATAASAQSGGLSLVPGLTTLDSTVTTVFTLGVYANADFGTHVFGGGFNLVNTGDAGMITSMDFTHASWGEFGANDFGHTGNGNHDGIRFGQFFIPGLTPPLPDSALQDGELLIGTFEVTIAAGASGIIDWTTALNPGSTSLVEIFDDGDDSTTLLQGSHGSARVVIFPTPSSAAILGLGGVIAGRRRR